LHHTTWIMFPRFFSEIEPVDNFSTERRQRHITASFHIRRTRFGKLACHTAHLHHWHRSTIGQYDCHLQNCADARRNLICCCTCKRFRAVATLQNKSVTGRGLSKSITQHINLTGEHQRWNMREFIERSVKDVLVIPLRCLLYFKIPPLIQAWIVSSALGKVRSEGFYRLRIFRSVKHHAAKHTAPNLAVGSS